jgi:predicted component of type VI protein secretion system
MALGLPQLVLEELPAGVEIEAPAGLRVGEAISLPPAVRGRWITIGAGPDQDIAIRDRPAGISRSHCRMIYRGGAFLIQGRLHPDGYGLNGERFFDCTARPLRDGDRVTIGKNATFRFTIPGPP